MRGAIPLLLWPLAGVLAQEAYGRLVVQGGEARLALPDRGEVCLVLPHPLKEVAVPPGVKVRGTADGVCLALEGEAAPPLTARLGLEGRQVRLSLEAGGTPATLTLLLVEDEKQNRGTGKRSEETGEKMGEPPKPPKEVQQTSHQGLTTVWGISVREGEVLVHLTLANTLPRAVVLQEASLRVEGGGKPLEARLLRGDYTSGRREWIPPQGSARLVISLPKPLSLCETGRLKLRIRAHILDKDMTPIDLEKQYEVACNLELKEAP